ASDIGASDAEILAGGGMNLRTVEIDGHTRVVGVASLGGRRPATAEQIAEINARLAAFEAPAPTTPSPPPPGVVTMEVEEVGRPAS
ncbi:MAG: cell wall hydrolase, partial [Brevundimonas sp.]|nr:cell wall hydrolase [Brevundimonas sp.]